MKIEDLPSPLNGAAWSLLSFPPRADAWLRFLANRRRYRFLMEEELRATRGSDTVFVFGSGWSLNELRPEEWAHFEEHDTLGFNWFVRQQFVRADYHLVRGIPDTDIDRSVWMPQVRAYFEFIRNNPRYRYTIFALQAGFRATNGNRATGYRLLPEANPVFLWHTRTDRVEPGRSFAEGLTHGSSTLQEAVNFAFLAGWRRIVLVGVDLYDRRYFWLPPGELRSLDARRGASADEVHQQASSGMVAAFGSWAEIFAGEGITLEVYNPRSLLAEVMPVYRRGSNGLR